MTSRDRERSRSWPNMLRVWYLGNGYRLGCNGPPNFITPVNGIITHRKQQKWQMVIKLLHLKQSKFRRYAAKVLSPFFIFAVFDDFDFWSVIVPLTGVINYVFLHLFDVYCSVTAMYLSESVLYCFRRWAKTFRRCLLHNTAKGWRTFTMLQIVSTSVLVISKQISTVAMGPISAMMASKCCHTELSDVSGCDVD